MLWFSQICKHERNHGLGVDAGSRKSAIVSGGVVWVWMLWSPYALGTLTELWFGHGCSGLRMLLEHERNDGLGMDALVAVCLEHEQNAGLGMDALVIESFWSMNGIMVWAWMLWSPSAPGTRTEFWFGHGCAGHRKLLEHERKYGLGMDALVIECSWNMNGVTVGHGCSGHRVLLEHERNYGSGMDALVATCSTRGVLKVFSGFNFSAHPFWMC